jgi:hypothetical protein
LDSENLFDLVVDLNEKWVNISKILFYNI